MEEWKKRWDSKYKSGILQKMSLALYYHLNPTFLCIDDNGGSRNFF